MSLAGSTLAPSAPARAGGFEQPFDGVRGVTAARESVELEATGSTPAGHPHRKPGGGDDDAKRVGDIFRGVLPGEQRASKTRGQGSTPCAPARRRRGRTVRRLPCKQVHAGSSPAVGFDSALGVWRTARDFPKVEDQVRLLARALVTFPGGVADARRPSKPLRRVRYPGGGLGGGPVSIDVLGV
jgi:hypothetical protein